MNPKDEFRSFILLRLSEKYKFLAESELEMGETRGSCMTWTTCLCIFLLFQHFSQCNLQVILSLQRKIHLCKKKIKFRTKLENVMNDLQ